MTPWIGVDLDGTLAEYHGWNMGKIGEPVPLMLERVKKLIERGTRVKIFTARAAEASQADIKKIQDWCEEHIGERLEVTCMKDMGMVQLWDDRCVQVQTNTGIRARLPGDIGEE